ncbi:hypothetical protein [Anatilimnocola floriformis]|uniref:hypothetical protein n=1 Tax=Anatilimnocola floriformis TaxID=2948575 RepID=UPI0020C37875|nr:hypothetical protein [Anatilimnocola floriformis]
MNRFSIVCLILSFFLLAGCDNNGGRRAVSGSITLNGKSLDKATIDFLELPDAKVKAAGALVTNGSYSIPAAQGLMPGSYRVQINAMEEFPITPDELAAGKTAPPAKNRVPPKYNTASEQTVEVKASGANRFDFNIE